MADEKFYPIRLQNCNLGVPTVIQFGIGHTPQLAKEVKAFTSAILKIQYKTFLNMKGYLEVLKNG